MTTTTSLTFRRDIWVRLLILVLALTLCGIFVAYAPRPLLAVVLYVFLAVLSVAAITTAAIGLAITAVVPPLVPVSQISVLGKRVMAFFKLALAVAAVFGVAFVGWAVSVSYGPVESDSKRFGEATDELMQLLAAAVVPVAIVFWMWLSFDLLRIRRRKRANAIDLLARKLDPNRSAARDDARRVAKWLVGEWGWILGAFYIVPGIVIPIVVIAANSTTS